MLVFLNYNLPSDLEHKTVLIPNHATRSADSSQTVVSFLDFSYLRYLVFSSLELLTHSAQSNNEYNESSNSPQLSTTLKAKYSGHDILHSARVTRTCSSLKYIGEHSADNTVSHPLPRHWPGDYQKETCTNRG